MTHREQIIQAACDLRFALLCLLVLLFGCAPMSLAPGEAVKVHPNGYTETVPAADNGSANPWGDLGQDIDIRTKPGGK